MCTLVVYKEHRKSGNAYNERVVDCMQAVTVWRRFNVPHLDS